MSQRWGQAAQAALRLCLALFVTIAGVLAWPSVGMAQGSGTASPSISNLLPANRALLKYGGAPVVSATIADASGTGIATAKVLLKVDGVDVTSQAVITQTKVTYTPTTTLFEGKHNVELFVEDMTGNGALAVWEFTTWTVPKVTSTIPAHNGWLNGNGPLTVTYFLADEGSGVDPSRPWSLSVDFNDVSSAITKAADRLTYTFPATTRQGLFMLSAVFHDRAGYAGNGMIYVNVDTLKPTITDMSPRDRQWPDAYPEIYVKYTDPTGNGVASRVDQSSVRLYLDGQDVTAKVVRAGSGNGPFSLTYKPTTSQPVAPGAHTVRMVVADVAGNVAESTWNFTTPGASAPPTLTVSAPIDGQAFAADALPVISGRVADAGGGVNWNSLQVLLDGQVLAATRTGSDGFTYTFTTPPSEGHHVLSVQVADLSGAVSTKQVGFKLASAPVIFDLTPQALILTPGASPRIGASYSDVGSGIDPASIKLFVDGVDVTAQASISASSISYQMPAGLADRKYVIQLNVADRAGIGATAEWAFDVGQEPEILSVSPSDTTLTSPARPTIAAIYRDVRHGIDPTSARLLVNDLDVTSAATFTQSGVTYTPTESLPPGQYTVYLKVANKANVAAYRLWGFAVEDPATYEVRIVSPGPQTVLEPGIDVVAEAIGSRSRAKELTLGGIPMSMQGLSPEGLVRFGGRAPLVDGINQVEVVAKFEDGEVRRGAVEVTYDAPVRVTITSPADKAMLGRAISTSPGDLTGAVERPVKITGRLSKPVSAVTINQQAARLLNGGTEFVFDNFFLREGTNFITAVAQDPRGRITSAAIVVTVDQTAPILSIETPTADVVTSQAVIDVRGMVNDAVEGIQDAPEPEVAVTVNGRIPSTGARAEVGDRFFVIRDVPLEVGDNLIAVTAKDQFGNARQRDVRVSRVSVGSARLTIGGGNHQEGAPSQVLARPLVVVALNAAGEPLPNEAVTFEVVRGTGSISSRPDQDDLPDGVSRARRITLQTDASGMARVWHRTGRLSGPGGNVIQATHAGIAEAARFNATTRRGVVAKLNGDLGLHQIAQTGMQPLEIMAVFAKDAEDNPIPGVRVVYEVVQGDAFFADVPGAAAQNEGRRLVLTTDKNGMTSARPWMGREAGLVQISARAVAAEGGSPDVPADLFADEVLFQVQTRVAMTGPASFKGQVYTDRGAPLAGARISIARTSLSSTTNERGEFELQDVPPGRIDLFIDGRTVNPLNDPGRPQWPSLHFEAYVVQGQENTLPHPIYLPPLLVSESKVVGGNEDVTLRIPGIDGFKMKVKANSVTFPDGSRTGVLVVSPVTADKLPMAPPAGAGTFGMPAWTIQPAGTRFDPPIEVTVPNVGGRPTGDNIPVVQWDHDLSQYVPMGRATVSEDGAVLVTDPGSGVSKAGWGGPVNPDPPKCVFTAPPKCGDCQMVTGICNMRCVADPHASGEISKDSQSLSGELNWGAQQVAFLRGLSRVTGADFTLRMKGMGVKTDTKACCPGKGKVTNKTRAVTLDGELEVDVPLGGPAFKKALAAFNAKVSLKGKAALAVSGQLTSSECSGEDSATGSGALAVGLELGAKWEIKEKVDDLECSALKLDKEGQPDPSTKCTIIALGAAGGVTASTAITVPSKTKNMLFDMKTVTQAYVKLDAQVLNMKYVFLNWAFVHSDESTASADALMH